MKQEETCEVHGVTLKPMRVFVSLGLPIEDKELFEARGTLFPHSRMYLQSCVSDQDPDYSDEMVCTECRKAERKWRKERRWAR